MVLFPEATLPLRIVQPSFLAAVERALNQANAPSTIGVVGNLIFCFPCFGFSKYLVLFYKKKLPILNLSCYLQIRVYREGAQFKYASVGTTAEVIFPFLSSDCLMKLYL